ncbi:hypothetical protein NQZ68_031982 [Dissostichus eleginoides]|nr:hypothetical protein NQZ68_031982 [Dissostichus eleginoides]
MTDIRPVIHPPCGHPPQPPTAPHSTLLYFVTWLFLDNGAGLTDDDSKRRKLQLERNQIKPLRYETLRAEEVVVRRQEAAEQREHFHRKNSDPSLIRVPPSDPSLIRVPPSDPSLIRVVFCPAPKPVRHVDLEFMASTPRLYRDI